MKSIKNKQHRVKEVKNTGVIVMNPQNGEILAEASYPNYDLNNPRDLHKILYRRTAEENDGSGKTGYTE